MPPVPEGNDVKAQVEELVAKNNVMVFSKSTCPFCAKVKDLFGQINVNYHAIELDQIETGPAMQETLQQISGQRTVPNVFIRGQHLGGCDDTLKAHSDNRLLKMINVDEGSYDFDLIVVGGGSGGLAASKQAALLGANVACVDFVAPSPQGTTWGLGGTCVNVGCIPKKLMHQGAIIGELLKDAKKFGWEVPDSVSHNWTTMKNAIQDHIGSLNWGYRVELRDKNVTYHNSYGEFIDEHTIKCTNKRGKVQEFTSRYFILATGGRPRYPAVPGMKEYAISSDDLFSLPYCPGKTLLIGASYVSLECAGFLAGMGLDVTVMVRSIFLRGFDQQMADKIGDYMAQHKVKFVRPCVPTKIERLEEGKPGKYRVEGIMQDGGVPYADEFNTVIVAVGRDPCTQKIGLDKAKVQLNPKNGYVVVSEDEQTSCSNVYAVGDILDGKSELTPLAIQAGRLLAKRLFGGSTVKCDYINVPTTVFTPLEYGCIGLSEEDAIAKYGEDNIEVYHSNYKPLEWTVAEREDNICYAKLICVISEQERVVGFHVLGPNAGEVTQGFTIGMKLGAKKSDFDMAIGIHPTCAEIFTTLVKTKRSNDSPDVTGC